MFTQQSLTRRNVTTALLAAVLLACGASACDSLDDQLESTSGSLSSNDFFDDSRTLFVRVKTCDWSAVAAHPAATCSVDPGFVLIGGGAEVEGSSPNALLTASAPVNLSTWLAASKDQLVSSPHRVRAYAVGLQVIGQDEATLRAAMRFTSAQSSPAAQHSTETVQLPIGFVAVSGGAIIGYHPEAGALLTESFSPDQVSSWKGSDKDHGLTDFNNITVTAIGLPACISDTCFDMRTDSASQFVTTGFAAASVSTPPGYVPASVGGQSQYNGNGRMLTKLIPFNAAGGAGAWVQSKDHVYATSGWTNVFTVSLRKLVF